MKNKIILANWKMQLDLKESVKLFEEIKKAIPKKNNLEIVVCPSFIALSEMNKVNTGVKNVRLGGQDVFWEDVGSYTGEISCKMLKEVGCEYVIIGHSDRRKYFKENDEMVHYKTRIALSSGLIPVICVGESYKERQEGRKEYVIINQVIKAFSGIEFTGREQVIIAYEPIWVIGSGQAIDAKEAEYMHKVIEKTLLDLFSLTIVESNFKIIYGGSIDEKNIKDFLIQPTIDGVLVGGASLKIKSFAGIINEAISIK